MRAAKLQRSRSPVWGAKPRVGGVRLAAAGAVLSVLALVAQARAGEVPAVAETPWWKGYSRESLRVALPDGRRLRLYCAGRGSPTVILDAGLGDGASAWSTVQPALARITRTCVYDRAGLGGSDPSPAPRTFTTMTADWEALLKAARVRGPYVVGGHSMGGMNAVLFTERNRTAVAGVVLVDPMSVGQAERLAAAAPPLDALTKTAEAPVRACLKLAQAAPLTPASPCVGPPPPDLPKALVAEYVASAGSPARFEAALAELEGALHPAAPPGPPAPGSWGDLPLVVLTAGASTRLPILKPAQQAGGGGGAQPARRHRAALHARGEPRGRRGRPLHPARRPAGGDRRLHRGDRRGPAATLTGRRTVTGGRWPAARSSSRIASDAAQLGRGFDLIRPPRHS